MLAPKPPALPAEPHPDNIIHFCGTVTMVPFFIRTSARIVWDQDAAGSNAVEKNTEHLAALGFISGVDNRTRTGDPQGHNLIL